MFYFFILYYIVFITKFKEINEIILQKNNYLVEKSVIFNFYSKCKYNYFYKLKNIKF